MIGKTILHYKILEKLGEGGMGVVYKAEDTKLKREVAIKFLPANVLQGKEEKERFTREAQAAAALNHANICHIYAIDEADGQTFIAMEFIEGKSLHEIVGANGPAAAGPLALDDAIDYATQIAAGLQAAHEKGITHRDIKSANIMVTDKGVVKIMDFGLAKLANRSKLTQLGTTLGTAAYMSPEQARGEDTDNRADIWSLGVVLYEMLSGQMPFKGDYEQAVIYSILHEEPEPLTALRTGVPIALDGIIAKALAKNPATRYQHVDELPADLKALETAQLSTSRIMTKQPVSADRFGNLRSLKILWLLSGLLIMAIGIAIWSWLRPSMGTTTDNGVVRLRIDLPPEQQFGGALTREAAISPDGQTIAYTAIAGGNRFLYVRQLHTFEPRMLVGTDGARNPFFSPDGKWIGFFVALGKLKKIPVAGGLVVPLCDARYGTGASWGPDNTIVFAPSYNSGLVRISADGGELRPVTQLDSSKKESSHSWPQFLPGGKAIIFTIEKDGETFDKAEIVAQVLDSGERKVLIEGGTSACYLPSGQILYARSNALLAVNFDPERMEVTGSPVQVLSGVLYNEGRGTSQAAVADNGTLLYLPGGDARRRSALALYDRSGASQALIETQAPYYEPNLSPEGRFVAIPIMSSNDDIWLIDTKRETQTRLTFAGENSQPRWSPDGNKIVFSSDRGGVFNLYSMTVDGSGVVQRLTSSQFTQFASACSPDGRFVVFHQKNPGTGLDLWLLPLMGEGEPLPFRQTRFNEKDAVFSPDGRWLAYESDESGQDEIYVQALEGSGKKTPISVDGGSYPKWSPKGDELFYLNDNKMMAVKISTGSGIRAGQPKALFALLPSAGPDGFGYDVMPDGAHFVVSEQETQTRFTRMNVVLNWFEELNRKVETGKP